MQQLEAGSLRSGVVELTSHVCSVQSSQNFLAPYILVCNFIMKSEDECESTASRWEEMQSEDRYIMKIHKFMFK
jgi:hypothetical protein